MLHYLLLLTLPLSPPLELTGPSNVLPNGALTLAQEMPIRYAGEGLTVLVTSFDESTAIAKGTIQLRTEAALPFWIELTVKSDGTEAGKGKVTDGTLERRISTRERPDGSVKVTYRAKRYQVTVQSGQATRNDEPPAASPASPATPKGTIRLRKHTFNDPKFNGQPSHTILVPDGWTTKGGALWYPNAYFKLMPSQEIKLTSPEGVSVQIEAEFTAMDIVPPSGSGMQRPPEGTASDGFPVFYLPGDLKAWKRLVQQRMLPEAHPKAKNLRVAEAMIIPDLTQMLHRELQPEMARVAQDNQVTQQMDMTSWVDAWALGFECYFTEGGKEFEEFRLMVIVARGNQGSFIGKSTMWNQVRGFTLTAPKGRLEAEIPLLLALMGSLEETEPWMRSRAQLMAKINNISHQVAMNNLKESAKRSKIMSDAQSEANNISMSGYRSRNASTDRSHESAVNAINETEYYSVPGSSSRVQLPSGYGHVYSNGAGEYLLTNDALLNPAADLGGGSWTAMKADRR